MTDDRARAQRDTTLRQTREAMILDAATRIFARDGMAAASMRAIAAEAGCTTGAIYPVFSSKEAIYAALLTRSLRDLGRDVREAAERTAPGPARVEACALAVAAYYADRPEALALGFHLHGPGLERRGLGPAEDADLNARLLRALDPMLAALEEVLDDKARAARAFTAIFAAVSGALLLHHTGRLSLLRAGLADTVRDQVAALVAAG